MPSGYSMEVLKKALLLEKRGKSFYSRISESTEHKHVMEFFQAMAEEEQRHIDALMFQYKSIRETGNFIFNGSSYEKNDPFVAAEVVFDEAMVQMIAGADYESAAIMAAIALEERSVKLYAETAESSENEEEKQLYHWLVAWENRHLNQLLKIDQAIVEKIWSDNNYWPY